MHTIFAGIHLQNKPKEILPLSNIDLEKNIEYLKELIAKELKYNAKDLELFYNGRALGDDLQQLSSLIKPNTTVHCFRKTKKSTPYMAPESVDMKRVQELFTLTAHAQISVSSRVNVLSKVLTEYPEFRRDLGAQTLIRDSVLFNTLHEPQVVEKLAKHYPLICDAASFIVSTIRKELARNSSATNFTEQATSDTTTSSEEENSIGASGSSSSETNRSNSSTNIRDEIRNEIRTISRQQLAEALAHVGVGSVNSLSNIAQRNTEIATTDTENTSITATPSNTSINAAGASSNTSLDLPITSAELNQQIARVFEALNSADERMDTSESTTSVGAGASLDIDQNDILPADYRQHNYAEQLRTMAQMGFTNHAQNLNFLRLADGNIEHAINLLMLSNS